MAVTRRRRSAALARPLLAVISSLALATAQQIASSPSEDAKPAATVDGEVITLGEVDEVVKSQAAWKIYCGLPKADLTLINDFRWNKIEDLVRRRLLLREVRLAAAISDERLDEMVQRAIREMGGPEKLRAVVALIRTDEAAFVRQMREQMAIDGYVQTKITPGISLSDEDVATAVQNSPESYAIKPAVHVRHILVRMEPPRDKVQDPPAARQRIEVIHQRVLAPGADFLAIAREMSECPSAQNGGDIGFVEVGAMGATFDAALASMQPGQISAPVRTSSGFHVFRLEERRATSPEAIRENARKIMVQNLAAQALQQRIDELRRSARVEILLPPRRKGPPSTGTR